LRRELETFKKRLSALERHIMTADLLNDQVPPFFAQQGMVLIRMLTDRGA
jgi:hypothetical protein